jgi:hypothetical protein
VIFIHLTTTDGNIWLNAELIVDIHQDPAHTDTCMVRYRVTRDRCCNYECSDAPKDIIQKIKAAEMQLEVA